MRPNLKLLILLAALAAPAAAQPRVDRRIATDSNVSVRLMDGSTVYGRLERLDNDSVVVSAASGRLAFPASIVRQVEAAGTARQRPDGSIEYWFPNSNSTRLFFAPTGRTLRQGEGYFADHWVVFGSGAVGVTDWVTVGGGGLMWPGSRLWFVTLKVGLLSGDQVNVAAGALWGGWGSETAGVAYVTTTLGSEDRSVTIGVGNGFSGDRMSRGQVVMLGGDYRVARRISLVTENYTSTDCSCLGLAYGVRFLGERISVDLAFINSSENPVFPGIPWLGFVVKW